MGWRRRQLPARITAMPHAEAPGRLEHGLEALVEALGTYGVWYFFKKRYRVHKTQTIMRAPVPFLLGGLLRKFDLRKMPLCMFVRDLSIYIYPLRKVAIAIGLLGHEDESTGIRVCEPRCTCTRVPGYVLCLDIFL